MSEDKKIKSHCNQCGHPTKHYLRLRKVVQTGEEEIDFSGNTVSWGTTYTVLECCGCEEVTLKTEEWFSEEPGWGNVNFFPPRISRREPRFIDKLPEKYTGLIREIYAALHADSRRIAMMGARTIVDLFIEEKVGDSNFTDGLKKLEAGGFISQKNKDAIKAAVEAGHAAAHRGHNPTEEDMATVMNIIEHLLEQGVIEASAADLKTRTPPRPPQQKKNQKKTK